MVTAWHVSCCLHPDHNCNSYQINVFKSANTLDLQADPHDSWCQTRDCIMSPLLILHAKQCGYWFVMWRVKLKLRYYKQKLSWVSCVLQSSDNTSLAKSQQENALPGVGTKDTNSNQSSTFWVNLIVMLALVTLCLILFLAINTIHLWACSWTHQLNASQHDCTERSSIFQTLCIINVTLYFSKYILFYIMCKACV